MGGVANTSVYVCLYNITGKDIHVYTHMYIHIYENIYTDIHEHKYIYRYTSIYTLSVICMFRLCQYNLVVYGNNVRTNDSYWYKQNEVTMLGTGPGHMQ